MYLVRKRKTKIDEITPEQISDEVIGLNTEAVMFIRHLMLLSGEENLEVIIDEIVKMDLDNKCMFQLLMAIESQVRNSIHLS